MGQLLLDGVPIGIPTRTNPKMLSSTTASGVNLDITFTKDVYFECLTVSKYSDTYSWTLNGNTISIRDADGSANTAVAIASGFASNGDRLQGTGYVRYFELEN